MRAIFSLVLFFTIFIANATDFHVSNTGNGQNDGLSENSPRKNIAKVNQEMNNFSSGDNISIEKGDEFFETLIISNKNHLKFDSYGVGSAPIITGGRIINNWINLGGNIFESNVQEPIYQLIYNNKLLNNARNPIQVHNDIAPSGYTWLEEFLNQVDGDIVETVDAVGIYYVSADGVGDGTSDLTPMSFSNAQTAISSMVAGETMAFKGGDEFYGNLAINNINGSLDSPITFTSYGTGKATIKGSEPITGWTDEGSNIWSKAEANDVYQIFKSDVSLKIGKTSVRTVTSVVSDTQFTRSDLIGAGNLVGAKIFIRSAPYRYNVRTITAFNNTTGEITTDSAPMATMTTNALIFITNSEALLLEQDDWYYNTTDHKIYMYSVGEPTNIEASNNTSNITLNNSDYITFDNLKIINSNDSGIFPTTSTNLSVINSEFDYCYQAASYIDFNNDTPYFYNNTITNSGIVGIESYSSDTTIIDNSITNTGLIANISWKWTEQVTGLAGGSAINTNNINAVIERNTITNTGFNGIDFRGANSNIKNNYISDFCLIAHDGGGIYTFNPTSIAMGSSGSTIEGNIVAHTDTSLSTTETFGIYLDDNTKGIKVIDNGINGCSLGIFFHNTNNHIVRNNNIFNSKRSGVEFGEDRIVGDGNLINNTFENNYIFSKNESFAPLLIRSEYDNYKFGVFNNNNYFNPLSKRNIKIENTNSDKYLSLKEWHTISNQDLNSKINDFIWDPFVVDKVISENLILNSTFEASKNNWNGWQSNLFLGSENGNKFLKSNTNKSSATVTSNTFAVGRNKTYLLEFDIKSDRTTQFWSNVRMDKAPYTPFLSKTIDSYKEWTHYAIQFNSDVDEAEALLSFTMNNNHPDLHLDNVTFTEVKFGKVPKRSQMVYNIETGNKTISLNGNWEDLDGNSYKGGILLKPFESKILIVTDNLTGAIIGNAGADVEICKGDNTVLEATGGSSFVWNTGETTASITVTPSETTTYSVTVSDGTYSDTDYIVVTVNEPPTVNAGSDVIIGGEESIVLTATGKGNFLWSTGETTESILVNPSQTTTYSVTASNACDSSDSDDITVTVIEKPELVFSNELIAPISQEIKVFPNPTNGLLNIELTGYINQLNINLYTVRGRLVYSETLKGALDKVLIRQINLARFGKGVYFVRITNNVESDTKKILVM